MSKAKYKIRNWKAYNQALIGRGSMTLWIDEAMVESWHCKEHHGHRGRGFQFSDLSIETALMIKGVFKLPLRALQGFIDSIFKLMDVPLKSPSYSCISKRAQTVEVSCRLPGDQPVSHLVIDATGLKVYGEGEWKVRKHGKEKRRVFRKLHLAVDAQTHEVIAAEVSLDSVGDNEVLPSLLNRLRRKIKQVSADGGYDTRACHRVLLDQGIKATIAPRSNAVFWEDGHPRNEAVSAMKAGALALWKHNNGYHKRSLAETAMSRYKRLLSGKLSLRDYNAQVDEALANVKAMNKMTSLGMPVSERVG